MAAEPMEYGHMVSEEVLIKNDLRQFLKEQYMEDEITDQEIEGIVRNLERLPA